jgi:DNA-binding Lrp family transcriptional regulator
MILSPMMTELKLNGNELIIFALIHGFSQDGESRFCGSLNYISETTNISRPTVIRIIRTLVEKNFITKLTNGKNSNEYSSNYEQLLLKYQNEDNDEGQNDTTDSIKMIPDEYQNDTTDSIKMIPDEYQNDTISGIKMIPNNNSNNIYNNYINTWNVICGNFVPKIIQLTEVRKNRLKKRISEWGNTPEEALATFKKICELITVSDFLCGRAKIKWTATFDWLIVNENNWIKIIENNYGNKKIRNVPDEPSGYDYAGESTI